MSLQDRSCGSVIEKLSQEAVRKDPANKERHVKTAVMLKMACALHLSVLDHANPTPIFESILGVVEQLIHDKPQMAEYFKRSCDESLLELLDQTETDQ